MQFLHAEDEPKELTYDDVFLMPQKTAVESRMEVDLTPYDKIGTTIPIIVANMNAVAGRRLAETVTRRGGMVVLPQDMPLEKIQRSLKYIKSRHPVFETPVVLPEDASVQTALNLINKRAHGAVMVVNQSNQPVGIFTEKDAGNRDRFTPLKEVMSTDMITMPDTAELDEIFLEMKRRRVRIMPIIKGGGELAGVLTEPGIVRSTIYKPAQNAQGQFLTAAALGINRQLEERAQQLLSLGVDIFVLDTAHGHQQRMLEAIRLVRSLIGPNRQLAAGNVISETATEDFLNAGANIVKVGVGPGAMCTTRMMTAMGRPQFTAVLKCAAVARRLGGHVWADGNIKRPRDAVLAIAAGAAAAFFASWFAGTYESAADLKQDEHGRYYKENFGMASNRAVVDRTREEDQLVSARKQYFQEGISSARLYLKPGEESAEDVIDLVSAGIRSACSYANARNLEEQIGRAHV